MFTRFNARTFLTVSIGALLMLGSAPGNAQNPTLGAAFTEAPIVVDGVAEAAWDHASTVNLGICMAPDLSKQDTDCATSANVKAMWDGPLLYLLFTVTDPDITVSSWLDTNRDGVELYIDQYDDKFPKFEEDDSYVRISAAGQQSGNATNAGLTTYPAAWTYYLASYATDYRMDEPGKPIGYAVELAWNIGDRPLRNGTQLGIEFSVNDASSSNEQRQHRLFWSSGNNRGLDDNSLWGHVELLGHPCSAPKQLNTFMLTTNIAKANALMRGIWQSEVGLDAALAAAKGALAATTQWEIDAANLALDGALRGLRRRGKYPDPYDLWPILHLNDPFTFFDGRRVTSLADWARRSAEIKDLAQYYEYGAMPQAPEVLTVTASAATSFMGVPYTSLKIDMQDHGNSASLTAALALPTTGAGPYPVIVSIDSIASPPTATSAYLSAGYAVLSIPALDYSAWFGPAFAGVATDDDKHGGAFFKLYPYDVTTGNDTGVLMAWAWGASRGVDALEQLKTNDAAYAELLDLDRLVVTGFSRFGKACLVAGMMDARFKVTAPGGSGSGGAAPYRYDAFGNTPRRSAPFGNEYPWGVCSGAETMPDHIRHQTHNSNEMFRRFLNDTFPSAVVPRMYKTVTSGYGERLPFDHHLVIAAIAPRAVLIDSTNDDYANNAEGDAIGYEGAKPVYQFLGAEQNLALDIAMGGGGHSLKPSQEQNIIAFSNQILFDTPLSQSVTAQLTTDPYLQAGLYETYYGGLTRMMPWTNWMPHANLLTALTPSEGALVPSFGSQWASYVMNVPNGIDALRLTPVSEDPRATITVNGRAVASGDPSEAVPLRLGLTTVRVEVTAQDGIPKTYYVTVYRPWFDQLVCLRDGSE